MSVQLCGIRGATVSSANTKLAIVNATVELLQTMSNTNGIVKDNIISAFFSVTPDLNAEFPAVAARELGWINVPLMCMTEIPVFGSLPMCIRILIQAYMKQDQSHVQHIYINGAEILRPDLAK